jgi:predicted TIM-barrel fold metal-dependent hydrolase
MIIDAHYHLDEHMESVDKLLSHMHHYDISRVALIPALNAPFTIDWATTKTTRPLQRALNGRWQKLGLRIYRATVTASGKFVIGLRRYRIYSIPDNENVARVIQAYPDKFFGWIMVNPNAANPVKDVEKWVGQPG